MVRKLTEWPFKRRPLAKIRPSDGCGREEVPLAVDQWYDFHDFGCHLGIVGLCDSAPGMHGAKIGGPKAQ